MYSTIILELFVRKLFSCYKFAARIVAPAAGSPGESTKCARKDEPQLDGEVRKACFLWSASKQKAARMVKMKKRLT